MNMAMVIDITRDALWITMLISGPMLIVGLVIGLVIGIFQAVTQIHEMTITFIPKIIGVGLILLLLLPWMLQKFMDYTYNLFSLIEVVGH